MLQLIIGRSGSGKTTSLYRRIQDVAEHTDDTVILLVPEQASFYNERRLLTEFGPVLSQRVSVLSFTRLAETVFRQIGGVAGRRMDDTLALLTMSEALRGVASSLSFYRRHVDDPDYLRSILDFCVECKQSGITPKALHDAAATLRGNTLRTKIEEASLIFEAYNALVASSKLVDPRDELTVLAEQLLGCTLFDGAHLFIDGFTGFSEQERLVLDRLMPHLASITVALCTDTVSPTKRDLIGRFSTPAQTAGRLQEMAQAHGLPIKPVEHLTDNRRTVDPALTALEQGCFAPDAAPYDHPTDAVCIAECEDREQECRFAARTIRRLLRENGGYCRDFTVVVRDEAAYADLLQSALRAEALPCTMDLRESVQTQPLIVLIESALACALRWDSADMSRKKNASAASGNEKY